MDPVQLLAPSNALGNPAPFWFLELFKVLGFTLIAIGLTLLTLVAIGFFTGN